MMRLVITGAASPELPLRIMNLLVQHGAIMTRAKIELTHTSYQIIIDADAMSADRSKIVIEKMRSMVLVESVERLEAR